MRTNRLGALACAWLVSTAAARIAAAEAEDAARVDDLEQRVERLEQEAGSQAQGLSWSDWTRRVRLGGSAEIAWFAGADDTIFDPETFFIWDTRLFLDADYGDPVEVAEHTIVRNVGFSFEWNLVRRADLDNDVGELYAELQGVLGLEALNVQFGRFQIPVGEAYLRYSRGRRNKPFVSDPVGGPWWWDEGVRIYGSFAHGRFGYVASVSDGDTSFNVTSTSDEQLTLKLFWRPTPWLHLSASALRSGKLGNSTSNASGALWLGEAWARAFGAGSAVDSYQDGVVVPDGPMELRDTWLVAADAILTFRDKGHVWLAWGRYAIDSRGGSFYDRTLHYWIAEAVVEGAWLAPVLRPFYAGFRASALGTYDRDEGYLVAVGQAGAIGYNTRAMTDYSAVLGWRLHEYVRLRLEYTHRDQQLVRGVTPAILDAAASQDFFAAEIGIAF